MRTLAEPSCRSAKIGPNAAIQLSEAFSANGMKDLAVQIYSKAGCESLLSHPPQDMIDESVVARLFGNVVTGLPPEMATKILSDAGKRTGEYVLANRIPRFARFILPHLPKRLAFHILLRAISKHAWTFAGSGQLVVCKQNSPKLVILKNPVATKLGCKWHVAVFNVLFSRLVSDKINVHEVTCCGKGESRCTFQFLRCDSPDLP